MKNTPVFKTMRTRLILWFLVVAAVPLLLLGALIYRQQARQIRQEALFKLTAVRDLKVQRVNAWRDEIIDDLETLTSDSRSMMIPDGKTALQLDRTSQQEVRDYFNNFIRFHADFVAIHVVDPNSGRVIISTARRSEWQDYSTSPNLTEPLRTKKIYFNDIHVTAITSRPLMNFSVPVLLPGPNATVAAVLVADINLESIDKFLQERIGMGETGETLLVNQNAIALTELRWIQNAPFRVKISAAPATLASQGKTGTIKSPDYRGTPVLAAYTSISGTRWGLVSKQDIAELYAPISALARTLATLLLICLSLVAVLAVILARSISQPLRKIQDTVDAIRKGDLTVRNEIKHNDEIGFLAKAFNLMAVQIQHQTFIQKGNREIMEAVTRSETIPIFSMELLKVIMQITRSELGTFYLRGKNGAMEPAAAEGVSSAALEPFDAERLEGSLGAALASRKVCHLSEIPMDTRFTFRTVAGIALPRAMLTIPLVVGERVVALIALATLRDYSSESIAVVEMSFKTMGVGFAHLLAGEETRRLAGELSAKNIELQAQTGELAAQAIELQKQSDTLLSQNTELEIQSARVTEASRLKSEFLSNMSHELRTPLNSVLALSRVLQMQGKGRFTPEESSYIEIIERNGKNLLSLINDILDLAKIESGRTEIVSEELSLSDKITTIAENLEPLCREKQISLHVNIEPDLPHLWTDERRVHQILQNIIGNAVKFTLKGQVTVAVRRCKGEVEITVADTGIGIPEEEIPHIFDEFRQVDGSSARTFEGSGLGLAIAAKSTQLLGGRIAVRSTPGIGSTFTISLPLTANSLDRDDDDAPAALPPPGARTVLVVDDDPSDASLLAGHLVAEGYTPLLASSGKEALQLAETARPLAILLDVVMPDLDGWEVLQALKKDDATAAIPVVIVSTAEDRATGLALGAIGVVEKPAERAALQTELRRAMLSRNAPIARNGRLLLVEDSEPAILQIRMVLESAGYRVDVARGGQEALDLMGNPPPDGIILDLMMPQIDGFEVLERLRGTPATAQTPVLILTAKNLTPQDLGRLSANHVRQLIQKGDVNREELLCQVKRLLSSHSNTLIQPSSPAQASTVVRSRPPAGKLPVILAIEDNPDNMATLRAILKDRCVLSEACDGEEGLRAALQHQPDLILLDLSLPKLDGFAVARRLRTAPATRNIAVVALTAHVMPGDREKALAAGCDDYLSKPINVQQLLATLHCWIGTTGGLE